MLTVGTDIQAARKPDSASQVTSLCHEELQSSSDNRKKKHYQEPAVDSPENCHDCRQVACLQTALDQAVQDVAASMLRWLH